MNTENLRRSLKRLQFNLKRKAPTIMVVVGAAGTVASTVLACRGTLKLEDTLDKCKEDTNYIKEMYATHKDYEEKQYKKDLTIQYGKNVLAVGKLYAPAVATEVGSLALIFGSHGQMCRRNANLAAAYATVDAMFKKYRKNVKDAFGEETDLAMRYGKVETVVDKKGKETKEVTIDMDPANYILDYSRIFGKGTSIKYCAESPSYNEMFLRGIQNWANDKLRADKFLLLNDVYDALGFEKTQSGYEVGWIYDKDNDIGDNYVTFRIFDKNGDPINDQAYKFFAGLEDSILLDFNVDGKILHNELLSLEEA